MNKIILINCFTIKSYYSKSIQKDMVHYQRDAEVKLIIILEVLNKFKAREKQFCAVIHVV